MKYTHHDHNYRDSNDSCYDVGYCRSRWDSWFTDHKNSNNNNDDDDDGYYDDSVIIVVDYDDDDSGY